MTITIDLDEFIDVNDKDVLGRLLNCPDETSLQVALTGIASASVNEYLEMLLGKQVPTKANEMQERRLLHLLKHYFKERMATETEIASMFQLTESGSSTLLRNTRTKYRFELEPKMISTIQGILRSATITEAECRVVVGSINILEELRKTVTAEAPRLDQIAKVKNSAGVYSIPADTFDILCKFYGVTLGEVEAAPTTEG